MAFLRFIFVFVVTISVAHAQVNSDSMLINELQGTFVMQDPGTNRTLSFEVKGDQVIVDKSYNYFNATLNLVSLGNNWGNHPAPVAQVILSGGSDEDVYNVILRFFLNKNKSQTSLTLIDAIQTKSDGPNGILSFEKLDGVVFKKVR